jgi:hypothetical protein
LGFYELCNPSDGGNKNTRIHYLSHCRLFFGEGSEASDKVAVMGLKSEVNWTRDLILSWLKMIGIELGLIKIEEGLILSSFGLAKKELGLRWVEVIEEKVELEKD